MMGTLWNEGGEIHLPERWAVLEEALRQINAEGLTTADGETIPDDSLTSGELASRDMAEDEPTGSSIRHFDL